MHEPPLTVGHLRVAGSVGPRLARALSESCEWLAIADRTDRSDLLALEPHLVILEAPQPDGLAPERSLEIVAHAREAGASTALWLTEAGHAETCASELGRDVDALFACDPGLARVQTPTGPRPVIGLPHAASQEALELDAAESERRVGLVIEARTPWSQQFRRELGPIIEAALEYPFAVLTMEPRASDLPRELVAVAEHGRGEGDRAAFLRRCGALVTASPPSASRLHVPAVAFDAVALGVPVVMALPFSGGLTLPRMVGLAGRRATAKVRLAVALEDREFAPGRREAGRALVRLEHTYAHRLATLASSFGAAVMPFPAPRSPRS